MHTKSLEILEKTELPNHQARAILEVMEMELADREAAIATKSDLKEALHALELKIESIKTEIQSVRAELKIDIGSLRADMNKIESRLSRWVLTCVLGQAVVVLGMVYFAFTRQR